MSILQPDLGPSAADANDFSNFIKKESAVVPGSPSNDEIQVQIVEFLDKLVVQISHNGELDSTYKIRIPDASVLSGIQGIANEFDNDQGSGTTTTRNINGEEDDDDDYDERHNLAKDILDQTSHIEPVCLIGNTNNFKLQVLCSQLVALVLSLNKTESRDVILSVSSKVFKGTTAREEDFDGLFFVMGLFRACYLKKKGSQ